MFIQPTLRLLKTVTFLTVTAVWTSASYGVTSLSSQFKAMTVSGSTLVALDFSNDLSTSDDDGASFTPRLDTSTLYNGTNENFTNVQALGTTVITVGKDGLVLRSADAGTTWAEATSPTIFDSLYGVAARTDESNSNVWIAVGDDPDSPQINGVILRSLDDGQNWTEVKTLADISLKDAIWTGDRWLTCGRDEFSSEGVIYSSTNGTNWVLSTVPALSAPLLALAADGSGVVLAVGEQGQILRSTDDGLNFEAIATEFLNGGDLNAIIADSSGTFFIGGDESLIIEVNGMTATTLDPADSTAMPILDFVLIDDVPLAVGDFSTPVLRTIPLIVQFSTGGSLDYVLTIEQTLIGKTYYLETTTDLTANDWAIVTGTSISGTGGQVSFDVSEDTPRRFWRVVEF